jgi:hypothetical protein
MPALCIAEALDEVEDIGVGLIAWTIAFGGRLFGFERRVKALHRSIVPDIARAAYRTGHTILGHQLPEMFRLHCPKSSKRILGITIMLFESMPQHIVVKIKITRCLGNCKTAFLDQINRLVFTLAAILLPFHLKLLAPSQHLHSVSVKPAADHAL